MPRSTMLTGISGSWTSRSASSRRSGRCMGLSEVVELLLEQLHHLRVAWSAASPAHEYVIPAAGIVEVPALLVSVECARERIVQQPFRGAVLLLTVSRHRDADLLHVRHDH